MTKTINSMHYNWRIIDGYNAPVTVVVSQRGLGKTFGKVFQSLKYFVDHHKRFVYVVETLEDVKTISINKGERFFASIQEYLTTQTSKRMQRYYNSLFTTGAEIESGETELVDDDHHKITGGTIKIGNETVGYLIALNSFGNLKRNNFVDIKYIIIDEFIPESIDIRHLQMPRKVASVIQTIARLKDVKIYMLGNAIRMNDILLTRLGLANMKLGEIRQIKDKYGLLLVAHYVDPSQYAKYTIASNSSVAGRLATLLSEDNLDKNEFRGDISEDISIPAHPKRSHLLFCLHDGEDSIRINATQDNSDYYVLEDYGTNRGKRYCFEEKYITNTIKYRPEWKEFLIMKYGKGELKFDTGVTHMSFKKIMKMDLNV